MASEKWGGAEKVFVDLSNTLAERHQVYALVLRRTEYLDRFTKKVIVIKLRSNPTSRNPFLLFEIRSKLMNLQADLVHTHAAKASELVYWASFFQDLKQLATKHNARRGRIFNRLPWVTVVSNEAVKSVRNRKSAELRVIHNGLAPHPVVEAPRNRVFTMAAIGRLDKIKGFDILISQLHKLTFPFILKIVGEGPERRSLEKQIVDLGMQDNVEMTGFVEDIPKLMNGVDLVVISSHSEGFPNVLVETLFYGNMIVSTPVGGVQEAVPPEFLCNHDNMAEKITDVMLRYDDYGAKFAALQETSASKYTLSRITEQYEEVYRELLASRCIDR